MHGWCIGGALVLHGMVHGVVHGVVHGFVHGLSMSWCMGVLYTNLNCKTVKLFTFYLIFSLFKIGVTSLNYESLRYGITFN